LSSWEPLAVPERAEEQSWKRILLIFLIELIPMPWRWKFNRQEPMKGFETAAELQLLVWLVEHGKRGVGERSVPSANIRQIRIPL
jgi:hypothetical protein